MITIIGRLSGLFDLVYVIALVEEMVVVKRTGSACDNEGYKELDVIEARKGVNRRLDSQK